MKDLFQKIARLFKSEMRCALEDLTAFDSHFVDKLFLAVDITMAENENFNQAAPKQFHRATDKQGAFGQIYWTAVTGQRFPLREGEIMRNYTFAESLQKQVYDTIENGVRFQDPEDVHVIVSRMARAEALRNEITFKAA